LDTTKAFLSHWYALYTKPRHEIKVALQIEEQGIEVYLPTIETVKKWGNRRKKIIEPLIRGYVFIHSLDSERKTLLKLPSIINTVCFNGKPAIIPDWQIENFKIILSQTGEVCLTDSLPKGSKVKILTGAFAGVQGVVSEKNKDKWISVSIDLLKRSVEVKLPVDSITKIINDK